MHRRDLLKAVLGVMGATALLPHVPVPALPPVPVIPPVPEYPWAVAASDRWPKWYIEALDGHGNSLGLVQMPLVDNVTGDVTSVLYQEPDA